MQYDRLAETVERHFPKWTKTVQDARLFVLEDRQCARVRDGENTIASWEPDEQVVENFRLPFECAAIEAGGYCNVLRTISTTERTFDVIGWHGTDKSGRFYSAKAAVFPSGIIVDRERMGGICRLEDFRVWQIERGKVDEVVFLNSELSLDGEDRNTRMGSVTAENLLSAHGMQAETKAGKSTITLNGEPFDPRKHRKELEEIRQFLPELHYDMGVLYANTSFLEIHAAIFSALILCEPSSFVVEHTHVDFVPKEPKKGKVIRSPYRPHYIVLTPGEIRKRFIRDDDGESIPSGMTRRPHERRGHFRKLTSEKFVSKRNHVIWVKPCWVGKTEGVIGKNRYVVRLDI